MLSTALVALAAALPPVDVAQGVPSDSRGVQDLRPAPAAGARLNVFLDCERCDRDFVREEVAFVDYVRDRTDADVHVLITTAETGAGGREYTVAFIGLGALAPATRTRLFTTEPSDPDDVVRRAVATAITLGLLEIVTASGIPAGLEVSVELPTGPRSMPASDRWNRWIFSLNGDAELQAEESARDRDWSLSVSADRVTSAWKISVGTNVNQRRQQFNLDEEDEEPFSVERHNRGFNWLVVRSLGEHWSAGTMGELRSSTFDNTAFEFSAAPAIEWNFFPYSMYTRRQLRVQYAIGASQNRYHEETLFGKLRETRMGQELSGTWEQREPWGTLESRASWSNFFPGLSLYRVSLDGEVDVRIARGLSVSIEGSASRIRDQISLPRRNATPEEVLLRLRQLRSGFETRISLGIEYQFGSAFASIVNPRFGR
jgi:hypothetical protein